MVNLFEAFINIQEITIYVIKLFEAITAFRTLSQAFIKNPKSRASELSLRSLK